MLYTSFRAGGYVRIGGVGGAKSFMIKLLPDKDTFPQTNYAG